MLLPQTQHTFVTLVFYRKDMEVYVHNTDDDVCATYLSLSVP